MYLRPAEHAGRTQQLEPDTMRRDRGRPIERPGRLAALVLAALLPSAARADGAFPDEFSIHFPANAPHRIYVGANFGLLVSEDDGATWRYACEPWVTEGSSAALTQDNVSFYHLTADGAAIIALSREVTRTEDNACTWPPSTGSITGKVVNDFFPDPTDPTLVLAVLVDASANYAVVASHDGGKTFDATPLYTTSTAVITGLELSQSSPGVIYLTTVLRSGGGATLVRSDDYGAHWAAPIPMSIPSGSEPLIMAIDPADANTVYLRVVSALNDSVVITTNAGQSFDTALTISGQFSAFLRADDGTLYAGTVAGELYVRAPGATTFTSHAAPHFRCLGQRPGTSRIFACGDMGIDGFSVGYSDNGGQTFQRMMSFTDLLGPLTCTSVATNCASHWERIQGVLGIGPAPDGGTGGPDAGQPDAGQPPPDAGPPPPSGGGQQKSGCSSTGGDAFAVMGLLVAAALLLARRRRRS